MIKSQNGIVALRAPVALFAAAFVLSGCLGPTYGTDRTAGEQLVDDLSEIVSLRGERPEPIDYTPRPGLVKPADTATLPEPQQNIADASGEWPESPEERLARIRQEADEGTIRPGLAKKAGLSEQPKFPGTGAGESLRDRGDTPTEVAKSRTLIKQQQHEEVTVAAAAPARRTYLTDPPVEYRQPADTAAYGDLGETESAKERARKKAAADPKSGWRRLVPWL
ncbi:hypothetical protein [Oricola cellulosilytica]|uniref:DUF3035 domain-containing protein n=1 Tax=Oricola cellulosilytica TaxID=1429082 RepID=A0A4R0PJY0_9HYPH|nr:hypothetical protein [Oricola cellulosilytica]TCD16640.1 hypothetical protein E0D97_04290 [Oricola cellulosilytica]